MRAANAKIIIIAAYFGPLPGHFPLWLASCRRNPDFDWLLLTEAKPCDVELPPNVHWREMTLERAGAIMSQTLGVTTRIETAYKMCDFRPAFWALLEGEERACDFWGHCDLDLIFGQLGDFITPFALTHFDKIFTLGHLTLYRNRAFGNLRFQEPHPKLEWREIFNDPRPRGFDEHFGVGLIWRQWPTRIYADESVVADIDPALPRFERIAPYRNDRAQLFVYDHGRVFRLSWRGEVEQREEFAYIHFQKRKPLRVEVAADSDCFVICPQGFLPFRAHELGPELAWRLNPWRRDGRYMLHRLRGHLRALRRNWSAPHDLGLFAK